MTEKIKTGLAKINSLVVENLKGLEPADLYDPIQYIMELGGKRLRPTLVLLSYNLFSDNIESALRAALGVEMFHNFTLMHDDLMDKAPLRRNKPTVHIKWNPNTAILSGDVMLVKAYSEIMEVPDSILRVVLDRFNLCAAQVCEGQQLDMIFEQKYSVTEADYLNMIKLKTAVLLGFSLELGAIIGGGSEKDQLTLRNLGIELGLGFQLMDDFLDVYANPDKFGKQVGGDIIANKKTFLLIKALELANTIQKLELEFWLSKAEFNDKEKVVAVTQIYNEIGIPALVDAKITKLFKQALEGLNFLSAPANSIELIETYFKTLMDREH